MCDLPDILIKVFKLAINCNCLFCVPPDIIKLQHVFKEEVIVDYYSFLNQDSKFSLKQEEDEHPQIKEEVEEVHINELGLKQEPGDLSMTSLKVKSPKTEEQTADRHLEEPSQESGVPVIVSVLSLANFEQQQLSGTSDVSQSQDQTDDDQEASTVHKRKCENAKKGNYERQAKKLRNTTSSSFTCDECYEDFKSRPDFIMHLLSHTDKDELICKTCQLR